MPLTPQFHGNNYEMTDQVTAKHRRYKLLCWRALCCGKDIINSRHIKYFSKDTITHKNMFLCVIVSLEKYLICLLFMISLPQHRALQHRSLYLLCFAVT